METPSAMTINAIVRASSSSKIEPLGASGAAGTSGLAFDNLCSELMQISSRRSRGSNTRTLELALHVRQSHGDTAVDAAAYCTCASITTGRGAVFATPPPGPATLAGRAASA